MFKRASRLAAVALAIAAAGCSGSDGAQGPQGPQGSVGPQGPAGQSGVNGKLSLSIDSVQTVAGTSTLTITIKPAGAVCPNGVCDPTLSKKVIGNQTFYAQEYNSATKTFDTAKSINFNTSVGGVIQFKGLTADGTGAQYTVKQTGVTWAPENSAGAFVYAYVTGLAAFAAPTTGHYSLPTSVASAAKVFGTIGYTSNANVSGCEKCHGKPYSKHGYRQATVAGLPDFVSCKVCHTDQKVGSDGQWFVLVDDPASYDPVNWDTTKYAYTANIMNDVHNSHAMEFNYPQSMANCVTCHANKLTAILTDANFKPSVCKSCHPVTGTGGTQDGRAPSFATIWGASSHGGISLTAMYSAADDACALCHINGGAPKFSAVHLGYNKQIYADAASANAGTKFSASMKAQVTGATYDWASNVVTVSFTMGGMPANSIVAPQVVASLYGYGSKDFIVSGHSSQFADKTPNLEWAEGALVRGTTNSANTNRVVVTPSTATAGNTSWTATLDLSTWNAMIVAGQVKQIEVGFLPSVGLDPTAAVTATNPPIAVAGATQTIDVSQTANAADARIDATKAYGKTIVDPKNCNACHDALGTTFHTPNFGSAGVVGCRLCHFVGAGSSHLEMQSRSIDSFVHALHSMQELDIKNIDPLNAVSIVRYDKHIEGNYPNFAGPLNCESCHNKGTYDVPDQAKSLPSIVSASSSFFPVTAPPPRTLGTFAAEITGPAARACGGCHRAKMINEEDGSSLAAFYAHTNGFSSYVTATDNTTFLNTAAYIEFLVGGGPTAAAVSGAKVEQCSICHPTAGSDHQALFNTWKNGL